jgi:hypothetical protein
LAAESIRCPTISLIDHFPGAGRLAATSAGKRISMAAVRSVIRRSSTA